MSILTKPYELSVWDDCFDANGQLQERRLGIIGSNEMTFQGRALNPVLIRNVNGEKKLAFQMYKQYTDIVTGESVHNPFVDWLISERKVKLKLDGEWYDFIVKDISEDSTNYLVSYSLEDALVQELAKNGFNVALDEEFLNNVGNARELGSKVLADTDWEVESEIFVQKVNESLVYLKTPPQFDDVDGIYHIFDQKDFNYGVREELVRGNLYPKRKNQFNDLDLWSKMGTWEVVSDKTDIYGNSVIVNTSSLANEYVYQTINGSRPGQYTLTAIVHLPNEVDSNGNNRTAQLEDLICWVDQYTELDGPSLPDANSYKKATSSTLKDWTVIHKGNEQVLVEITFNIEKDTKSFRAKIECNSGKHKKLYLSSLALRKTSDYLEEKTILAFYSSCTNKPHRFQFIYCPEGYDALYDNYYISVNTDRAITEADCQFYIDFDNPSETYYLSNGIKTGPLSLYLPNNFEDGTPGKRVDKFGEIIEQDTTLSSWYRGDRYGYAPQSLYVPMLERYCTKFKKHELIPLLEGTNIGVLSPSPDMIQLVKDKSGLYVTGASISKEQAWSGVALSPIPLKKTETILLKYDLLVEGGELYRIGGHCKHYQPIYYKVNGIETAWDESDEYIALSTVGTKGAFYSVEILYKSRESADNDKNLYIQPNRGNDSFIQCKINNLNATIYGDYLGYTDSLFVSPVLIQNFVNNYGFESTAGWKITSSFEASSQYKGEIENVYGRFDATKQSFVSILDDFYDGGFSEDKKYKTYMQMSYYDDQQFVLNSGPYDNRTTIGNMPQDEKWILDYRIVDVNGNPVDNDFEISLGEYRYNTDNYGCQELTNGIVFSKSSTNNDDEEYSRIIFTVNLTNYTEETFKKNSQIYIKIKPKVVTPSYEGEKRVPTVWYIEKLAFYKKHEDVNGNIIVPDYLSDKSSAAEEYIETSKMESIYYYFDSDQVLGDVPITNKDQLNYTTDTVLKYDLYEPVYNYGAEKVRTVSEKESNYFNILQSIAETFEAWMSVIAIRNNEGAVIKKKVRFKNYAGKENHANFRYGVNLQKIQRTFGSKDIVTKLIVKPNTNELAPDGYCAIQLAGENPSGENCIYDFQYYHNTGVMDAKEYYNTVYLLDGAAGPDGLLWDDKTKVNYGDNIEANPNGYFLRTKEINKQLKDIGAEIFGLSTSLGAQRSKLTLAQANKDTATNDLHSIREGFLALTGLYPEETTTGQITSIRLQDENNPNELKGIMPMEGWWAVDTDYTKKDEPWQNGIKITGNSVEVAICVVGHQLECNDATIDAGFGANLEMLANGGFKLTSELSGDTYQGAFIETAWENEREYILEYDIVATSGTLITLGGHIGKSNKDTNSGFYDYTYTFSNEDNSITTTSNFCNLSSIGGGPYHVTFKGIYKKANTDKEEYPGERSLWIQPNLNVLNNNKTVCEITNIRLTKYISAEEAIKAYDRDASFYLNLMVGVGTDQNDLSKPSKEVARTYRVKCKVAKNEGGATVAQSVTTVDNNSADIKSQLQKYVQYYNALNESTKEVSTLQPAVESIEEAIRTKESQRKQLNEFKTELNKLFFKKYSRFITEGTWLSEEYVDHNKYYADAQSILYNSCYPKVAYNIDVLSLSSLPGYEMFKFDLGDKTYAIDEQFFGTDKQEEVIVTEISEALDNPEKTTIKVQNFKNQFQDLFQKITATVQQTQFNAGSYKQGAELINASVEEKSQFVTDALNKAHTQLALGNTHTVVWDEGYGILVTDDKITTNQIRITGGAIMLSSEDPQTGKQTWRTGLTNDGISADLITAGQIKVGKVQILSGEKPVFRWDSYGITAYDAYWNTSGSLRTISGINPCKFVRFDKNGIYGIDNVGGIDGGAWYPTDNDTGSGDAQAQIDKVATFALTWSGLKVTGNDGVVARIGKLDDAIIKITNKYLNPIFQVNNDGTAQLASWNVDGGKGYNSGFYSDVPATDQVIEEDSSTTYTTRSNKQSRVITTRTKNPAYRVGFKTESGKEDRYAIYVKKFREGDFLTSDVPKPTGDMVFGVKFNGEVIATAGKIAGWTIEKDKLGVESVALCSGDDLKYNSAVVSSTQSPARFYAGKGKIDYTVDVPFYNGLATIQLDENERQHSKIINMDTTKRVINHSWTKTVTETHHFQVTNNGYMGQTMFRILADSDYELANSLRVTSIKIDGRDDEEIEYWHLSDNDLQIEISIPRQVTTSMVYYDITYTYTVTQKAEPVLTQVNDYTLEFRYTPIFYPENQKEFKNYTYTVERVVPRFYVLDDGSIKAEAGSFGSLQISQFSVEGLDSRINQFEIAIPTSMQSGGSLKHGYNYFGSGGLFCPDINDSSRGALITNGAIRINGYASSSGTTFQSYLDDRMVQVSERRTNSSGVTTFNANTAVKPGFISFTAAWGATSGVGIGINSNGQLMLRADGSKTIMIDNLQTIYDAYFNSGITNTYTLLDTLTSKKKLTFTNGLLTNVANA